MLETCSMKATLICYHASTMPSQKTLVIFLFQRNRKINCTKVLNKSSIVFLEKRCQYFKTSFNILIEVRLHYSEAWFIQDTKSSDSILVHFKNGCAFILKISISVLTINIKDDLTNWKLWSAISCKRIRRIRIKKSIPRSLEIGCKHGSIAYLNCCLDNLLDSV